MVKTQEKLIRNTIEGLMESKPDRNRQEVEGIVRNYFEKGIPFYKSMGMTQEFMDSIYSDGYRNFQSGKYPEAYARFGILHSYDWDEPKYIFAQALCLKEMKRYALSINEFMNFASKVPGDPNPFWHMYECFDRLDEPYGASSALGAVIHLCIKAKGYADLKLLAERALMRIVEDRVEAKQTLEKTTGKKEKK